MTSTVSSRPAPEYYPAYHAPPQTTQQRPTLPPIAHLERLAQLPPRTSYDEARVRPLSDRPHDDAVTPPDDAGLPAYVYPPSSSSSSTPPTHVYADVHPESQMSIYAPQVPQNDEFFAPPAQAYAHEAHSAPPQLQKSHEEHPHHPHHPEQQQQEEEESQLEMDIQQPDPPPVLVPAPTIPAEEPYVVDWLDFTRTRSAHFIAEKTCEMICYLWFAGPPSTSTTNSAMETPPPTPPTAHATPATGGEGLFASPAAGSTSRATSAPSTLQLRATPTFVAFMQKLLETTQVSQSVIVLSLHYIYRLKERNRHTPAQPGSEFRIGVAGLMMGNKFLDECVPFP